MVITKKDSNMLFNLDIGNTSAFADPLSGTRVHFEFIKEKDQVSLANCIRHGIMTRHGDTVSREARGLGSKNFSLLLPETIIDVLSNCPLYIPPDIYSDKVLIFLGDREQLLLNKNIIGKDFVRHSTILSVPMFSMPVDYVLTTDDLTVFVAPFNGEVQVLSPRVLFPAKMFLGKLGANIGVGFALSINSSHHDPIRNRLFRVPSYTYGPISRGMPEEVFKFAVSLTGTYPTSMRHAISEIISETKAELMQIVHHIEKNRNSRPIFYGTSMTQPLRLIAETATLMDMDCGIARVMTPISDKDSASYNIVFLTTEIQHEFILRSEEVLSDIEKRLDAFEADAIRYFPAILASEAADYPVFGKEADRVFAKHGMDATQLETHVSGISAYVSRLRTELDDLGEVKNFSVVEDYVRGVSKAAIRDAAKSIRYLTNAGVKIAELVSMYPKMFDDNIDSVFLAGELPGSFVNSLINIYGSKFKWVAQSLLGGTALDDSYGFVKKFPKNWDFGPKTYSGDITNKKLRTYYTKQYGPDSPDGGRKMFISDIGADGKDREKINAPLYDASAELAISVLAEGGVCVLKTFGLTDKDMIATTVKLMRHFDEVRVAKPTSSSPFNLEVYVICIGFSSTPREEADIDMSALKYAITANLQKITVSLNRLDAYTQTMLKFGLAEIPYKTTVESHRTFIEKLFESR